MKEHIERVFVLPLAKRLDINPNYITFLSVVSMLLAVNFTFGYSFYLAALFVLISGYLDLLDGTIAKYHKHVTKFGAFFDRVADRVNDMLIISSIILSGIVNLTLGILVLILIMLSSYTSSVIESQTKNNIGEKLSLRGVRLFILISGLVFNYVTYAFYLLAFISLLSFVERFYTARRILK